MGRKKLEKTKSSYVRARCYKEDVNELQKRINKEVKSYYKEFEEEKKGYCDELWCITDYLNLCI